MILRALIALIVLGLASPAWGAWQIVDVQKAGGRYMVSVSDGVNYTFSLPYGASDSTRTDTQRYDELKQRIQREVDRLQQEKNAEDSIKQELINNIDMVGVK